VCVRVSACVCVCAVQLLSHWPNCTRIIGTLRRWRSPWNHTLITRNFQYATILTAEAQPCKAGDTTV